MATRNNLAGEKWKPVPGYEARYEVSNFGRVWSIRRTFVVSGLNRACGGRFLKLTPRETGYIGVSLFDRYRVKEFFFVHKLVLLAFSKRPKAGQQVNHIDGNKQNNSLTNLEWVTQSENIQHSVDVLGVRRGRNKLNFKIAEEIRRKKKAGMTGPDLAKMYGVNHTAIYAIVSLKSWRPLLGERSVGRISR